MALLNIGTYLSIIQKGFKDPSGNQAVGQILFNTVINNTPKRLAMGFEPSDKEISYLFSHQKGVHKDIKVAIETKGVPEKVIEAFNKTIVQDHISQITGPDMYLEFVEAIKESEEIKDKKRFLDLYNNEKYGDFLASVFLYSLSVDNKECDKEVGINDVPLLQSFQNRCPVCRKQYLIRQDGEATIRNYKLVHIFPITLSKSKNETFSAIKSRPSNLESRDNLIPLCINCANDYEANPTLEKYQHLLDVKSTTNKNNERTEKADTIELEKRIRSVLTGIGKAHLKKEKDYEFTLDPKTIDEKIEDKYVLLKGQVSDDVDNYYGYLRQQFSELGDLEKNDFNEIGGEMRLAYQKQESIGENKDAIYAQLVNWILRETGLDDSYYLAACIVVSFFVQNCQVFKSCNFQAK